ncbi:hypothetical protein [Ammoniphilus sp. CFH 90114]|uniref:hypothetical protein n=1 Tax=Ammoniphilus sp. CFH 90114 TaxID=2493665 RepID=UPI00100E6A9C|nr:hypothetical protein [Ammoniphilus sp. CFH 90114]RXT06494.1 hypothetical protein EIZ39_15620 [Ammoniphilus sp. CFH 90114]
MKQDMLLALDELSKQWERNQRTSILENAEDEATYLEHKFYKFIDCFKIWFLQELMPISFDAALEHPDIQYIIDQLPSPLYLPFENELDLLVDGVVQENDEKYD